MRPPTEHRPPTLTAVQRRPRRRDRAAGTTARQMSWGCRWGTDAGDIKPPGKSPAFHQLERPRCAARPAAQIPPPPPPTPFCSLQLALAKEGDIDVLLTCEWPEGLCEGLPDAAQPQGMELEGEGPGPGEGLGQALLLPPIHTFGSRSWLCPHTIGPAPPGQARAWRLSWRGRPARGTTSPAAGRSSSRGRPTSMLIWVRGRMSRALWAWQR